jgi:hypothetical protein
MFVTHTIRRILENDKYKPNINLPKDVCNEKMAWWM